MSSLLDLRRQVHGLIKTCQAVLTNKKHALENIDETTLRVAEAVLKEAKDRFLPEDKVVAAVALAPPVSWTALLTAMTMVYKTLPLESVNGPIQVGGGGSQGWMGN